jgi:hypothetical protein
MYILIVNYICRLLKIKKKLSNRKFLFKRIKFFKLSSILHEMPNVKQDLQFSIFYLRRAHY